MLLITRWKSSQVHTVHYTNYIPSCSEVGGMTNSFLLKLQYEETSTVINRKAIFLPFSGSPLYIFVHNLIRFIYRFDGNIHYLYHYYIEIRYMYCVFSYCELYFECYICHDHWRPHLVINHILFYYIYKPLTSMLQYVTRT